LRLVFALLVIVSHSIPIGGFGNEIILGNQTLGDISVDGFFGISGFLICGSAVRHLGRHGRLLGITKYFWDRVLRIFPAFWLCLLVTAGIFGAIGWYSLHSTMSGYWSHPLGPLHYVVSNSYLRMNSYKISGTPAKIPYSQAWDGSLWTLSWEFLCYIGVAILAVLGLLARRRIVLVLAMLLWLAEIALFFSPLATLSVEFAVRFGTVFVTGALVFLYRDRIPDSSPLALLLALVAVVGTGIGHPLSLVPDWLTGPALVYPTLWLGAHLPCRKIGATNDLSYGVYIYAFPVGQLLAIAGVQRAGYVIFLLATVAGTFPLAAASWWGVEKWAMRARNVLPLSRRATNSSV
jgi:peptidoglycan/LPS O-acetylase OafA/YrhL